MSSEAPLEHSDSSDGDVSSLSAGEVAQDTCEAGTMQDQEGMPAIPAKKKKPSRRKKMGWRRGKKGRWQPPQQPPVKPQVLPSTPVPGTSGEGPRPPIRRKRKYTDDNVPWQSGETLERLGDLASTECPRQSKRQRLPFPSPGVRERLQGTPPTTPTHDDYVLLSPVGEGLDNTDADARQKFIDRCVSSIKTNAQAIAPQLADENLLLSITNFFELIRKGDYSLNNISLRLFCDTIDFHKLQTTTQMKYPVGSMDFWKCGHLLFGGRFPLMMGGPKNRGQIVLGETSRGKYDPQRSSINFAVPDLKTLRRYNPRDIPSEMAPGIIEENLDLIKNSDRINVPHILSCDGKKVASGLDAHNGDIDCFGFEDGPTLAERRERRDREKKETTFLKELFMEYHITEIPSPIPIVSFVKSEVETVSRRLKDLRFLTMELEKNLRRYMKDAGDNWRETKFKFCISETRVMLSRVKACIGQALDIQKRLCLTICILQGSAKKWCELDTCDVAHNMAALKDVQFVKEEQLAVSENVKQRSTIWHNIREQMVTTASQLFGATGMDSLKVMKELYNYSFHKVPKSAFSEETLQRMRYGTENEEHALATMAMRVLPVFFPDSIYVEEGIYITHPDGDVSDTCVGVSPDGSIRHYDDDGRIGEALGAIEVKCPYASDFKTPVPYRPLLRYVTQCLAEMYALNVDTLLFGCWSPQSTTVFQLDFDPDLWRDVISALLRHFDSENPQRPTRIHPETAVLKNKLGLYLDKNCKFLAEIPSLKVGQMNNNESSVPEAACEVTDNPRFGPTFSGNCEYVVDYTRLWHELDRFIEEAYDVCRLQAKEVFACMLSEMNRSYHVEIPHAVLAAYGMKGYSMSVAKARCLLDSILEACHSRGIRVPCVCFDGQWSRMIVRDRYGRACTKLQAMKDCYEECRKKPRHEILAYLKSAARSAVAAVQSAGSNEYRSISLYSEDGALRNVRTTADPSCWVTAAQKRRQKEKEEELSRAKETINLDIAPSAMTENEGEFRDLIDESLEDDRDSDVLPDLEPVPSASFAEVPESLRALCEYLETECVDVMDEWLEMNEGCSAAELRKVEVLQRLTVPRLNEIVEAVKTLKLSSEKCLKSYKKMMKINFIHRALGGTEPDLEVRRQQTKTEPTSAKELRVLAYSAVDKLPKNVLNAALAGGIWPAYETKWIEHRQSSIPMDISSLDVVGERIENYEWYYLPNYDNVREELELFGYDSHHLLVNLRTKINKDGLPLWGVKKEAWVAVCEKKPQILSPAIVKHIIDRQNAAYARQCFSLPVEDCMRELDFAEEANFCKVIREWYEAEDKRGMPAADRFYARQRLKEYFLKNFKPTFPPPGNNVRGMSLVMFEGFLTSVEGHILLYAACPEGYNQRSVGSQDVENFFNELTESEQTKLGCPKATTIKRLIAKAVTLYHYRANSVDRSFHFMTRTTTVYPVKPLLNLREMAAERERGNLASTAGIVIRDHDFDTTHRPLKPQHKKSMIHGPREQTLGVRGVRQHYTRDDSQILADVRAGVLLDSPNREAPF